MRRGDIVIVAGGVCASKPRPALVLQDDPSAMVEVERRLLVFLGFGD